METPQRHQQWFRVALGEFAKIERSDGLSATIIVDAPGAPTATVHDLMPIVLGPKD